MSPPSGPRVIKRMCRCENVAMGNAVNNTVYCFQQFISLFNLLVYQSPTDIPNPNLNCNPNANPRRNPDATYADPLFNSVLPLDKFLTSNAQKIHL